MRTKITIEELQQTSPEFASALIYAKKLTTDQIFEYLEQVNYQAAGFAAVGVYKMKHTAYWEAYLRNDVFWDMPTIECIGKTAKEAIELMYAWCVYRKYLVQANNE